MKSPTWSADGSKLVFSWQNGGRLEAEEVKLKLADIQRRLIFDDDPTDIPENAIGVERKDGILKYTIPADAYWSLKQVDLNSGQLIDLPSERHSYGPTGHPSQANQVIYRGDRGLALHSLDTGTDQVITTDARDHTPVISPDVSRIAVSYWQDDHWEIHTMNIDGTGRQRLTFTPLTVLVENRQLTSEFVDGKERFVASETPAWNHAAPVWSPDGSQIAFVTDRTGLWEIWLMNADGSNQRPMFPNGALAGITLNYFGVDERMLSWR
jgi:Tol biopolymer transport system component